MILDSLWTVAELWATGERFLKVQGLTDIQQFEAGGHVVVVERQRRRRRVLVEYTVAEREVLAQGHRGARHGHIQPCFPSCVPFKHGHGSGSLEGNELHRDAHRSPRV